MRALFITALLTAFSAFSCTFLVDFEEEPTYEDCVNGMDDDSDGHADCDDQDCWDLPACSNQYEDCYNRMDDDLDGLFDCEDPDCSMDPNCWTQSDLCNDTLNDELMTMYTQVFPESPSPCQDMGMQCRIDRYGSNGVPRCVYTEPGKNTFEACDNDLECPMGNICAWSEVFSMGMEDSQRNVCLPLCSNAMNIYCPEGLLCFNTTTVMDDSSGGEFFEVLVTACDRPICAVLGLNSGSGCLSEMETCFPTDDMMGQGYCGRFSEGGPLMPCNNDSECLPKHKCADPGDGSRLSCHRVCSSGEDCIGLDTNAECVKHPYWATYGICISNSFDGNL